MKQAAAGRATGSCDRSSETQNESAAPPQLHTPVRQWQQTLMDAGGAAPHGHGFQLFGNTAFEVDNATQPVHSNALFDRDGADGASVDSSSYDTVSQSHSGSVQQDAAQQLQAPQRQPPQRRPSHDAACQAAVQQTQAVGAALQNEAAASAVAAAMLAAAQ